MVAMPTVVIRFKCKACGLNAPVKAPARASPSIDVAHWMENVAMPEVGKEHARLRPRCRCRVFDLLLPLGKDGEDTWIGKAGDHVPPAKAVEPKGGDDGGSEDS